MPSSSILDKSLGLLDRLSAADRPLTLGEITDMCELPKSSVHRLLVLLRDNHTLSYDAERQTYQAGSRIMRWSVQTMRANNLPNLAAPHMRRLCRQSRMRVALSVLDGETVLYLHTIEVGEPFRLAPKVGQTSPLHASAAGKLFLAAMPQTRRAKLLNRIKFEQCTEFTKTNAIELETEIGEVDATGFAVSAREEFRQTSGLAVPITNDSGKTIAGLSIWNVGDVGLLEKLKSQVVLAKKAASEISKSLGYLG